ncbi:PRTRC system protein A [Burkholderia seminalis]|uniref:PRTRC system protein A n=1 Tax=Burkholderia seminalis TaxID=488731 RepID=UPI001CF4E845|nr:PRTRC system protein A [Burkholderia seminalis]MCA7954224.1 PRTRC system protein A [Burkholderia seminalis]
MNPIDTVLHQSFPAVMVPSREVVEPMARLGERLLIGGNGVFLEVVRPWIRTVRRIAMYHELTAVPYGEVSEVTELHCGPVPPSLIAEFHAMAQAALPNEVGAWIVWNSETGGFRIVALPSLSHGTEYLVYERPRLADGEWMVVDCHSHGTGRAFFSRKDNKDDRHDVKFAFVLGNCDRQPSRVLRLCVKGIFQNLPDVPEPWAAALAQEVA